MRIDRFIVCLIFCAHSIAVQAQEQETSIKKTFWQSILGDPMESAVTFMPTGSHTRTVDVFGVWYTAYNYKSIEIAAFSNSYQELTFALFYKRSWKFSKRFSVLFGGGIVYGYHGKLSEVEGVPLKNTFLFTGEINPVLGIELNYRISERLSIASNIAPLIVIYGLKYHL